MNSIAKPDMPDVAAQQTSSHSSTLDWVGMSRIALPLIINDQDLGEYHANTFVETYVNIANPQVKGIHMSRLYLLLAEFARQKTLTINTLAEFLPD